MVHCRLRNADAIVGLSLAAAVVALVVACATEQQKYGPDSPVTTIVAPIERLAFVPLVPKLPLTVGIYYPAPFRDAATLLGGGNSPRYRFEFGDAAMALFEQNAAALFGRTVVLSSPPGSGVNTADVELVLVPWFQDGYTYFVFGMDVLAPGGTSIVNISTDVFVQPAPDARWAAPHVHFLSAARPSLADPIGDLSTALVSSPEVALWAGARGFEWQWPIAAPHADSPARPTGVAICNNGGWVVLRKCSTTADSLAVGEALRKLDPSIKIIPADEVRGAFHPWLAWADRSDAQVAEWLSRPIVAARANEVGIRYLVVIESIDTWTQGHGGIGLVGGVGAAGFFGLAWWTNNEVGRLRVFDFVTGEDAGNVRHNREDVTLALPAFILPLPIPIPRQGSEPLADVIAKLLLPLVRTTP